MQPHDVPWGCLPDQARENRSLHVWFFNIIRGDWLSCWFWGQEQSPETLMHAQIPRRLDLPSQAPAILAQDEIRWSRLPFPATWFKLMDEVNVRINNDI